MRVFVTDGENRAALAVTRSLGRAGHEVVVGEKHSPSLAQTSRYCAARSVYPDPVSASDEFIEYLAAVVRDQAIDVLLPVADITTFLITRHRDRFRPCAVPFADADVVERAANKVDLVQTALRLGVPVPRTVVVDDPARIPQHDLGYPLVIKPRQSKVRTAAGWVSGNVSYAADAAELARDVASRPAHHFPVMLQERIVGPGVGVFACYHAGRPVALFGHRRIRERPPWGGVSVLSESVPLCPLARDYATALLDEIGWHGVAMVEFKRDVRDGVPKLMEINGRLWGSLQLAIDAGVDFPGLLVQSVHPGRFEPQAPYRVGVRNRWFWGDVDSLLLSLFGNGGPPGRTDAGPLRALLNFMDFWGRDLHYDNPKWHDMRPWFFETYRRFETVARSLAPAPAAGEPTAAPALRAERVRASRPPAFRGRIVASLDDVGLDGEAWNALAARSDTRSVFQTYEWTRSWLATIGDQYQPWFVTVSDGAGVRGVAPLVVEARGAGERIVRFLGDGRADYLDLLAGDGEPLVVDVMFDALREHGRWDVIELNNIPGHSRTPRVLRDICAAEGYRMLADDQYPCPALVIEGHEEEARRIANKPSLRRRTNYFNRSGRLVCRNLGTARDIEPYLEAFFDQHVTRWGGNGQGNSSLFVDPRNRSFYRELTRWMTGRGWLLFSVVEFNDRPIAFHYGFDYNGSVIWYKPSFDVAFEHHSPGIVMVRHLIGYALDQKRRELDFTVGDEPFKRRFTNDMRQTVRVRIFRDQARYYWECSKRELVGAVRKLAR